MKLKLIACKVFRHEIEYCAGQTGNELDIEFLDIGEHARPGLLREKLQGKINETAAMPAQYDAILLAYGLCGRAIDGLAAKREKLIIPRSHDCCGILLGSRKRFEKYFRDMPSTPFSSPGYVESGSYFFLDGEIIAGDEYQSLVEQYGEDNAKYIYGAMHPTLDGQPRPIYYIDTPELKLPELLKQCQNKAETEGYECRILRGDLRLISMLLSGNWPEDEFLTILPGTRICMTADWDTIITAR